MKKPISGVLVFFLSAAGILGETGNDYRTFTDVKGRTSEARIMEFDTDKSRLRLERRDGRRCWISPGIFSDPDQIYIREWILADRVLSEEKLGIKLKKRKINSYKFGMNEDDKAPPRKMETLCFEVSLNNRFSSSIEDLLIEYCYYVTEVGSGTRKNQERTQFGEITIRVDGMSGTTFATEEIDLQEEFSKKAVYSRTFELSGYEYDKLSEEQLDGIWLRIYGPPVGGVRPFRDVCYPEDLQDKVEW